MILNLITLIMQVMLLDTMNVQLPDSTFLSSRLGFENVERVNTPFVSDPNNAIPGVVFYADGASPFGGYSYIKLRGGDPTRISWTLGNFSLSELEDFGFYPNNIPGLLKNFTVGVQRGPSYTVGTLGLSGAVRLKAQEDRKLNITQEAGSWGYQLTNIQLEGVTFSYTNSDGYRDNSQFRGYSFSYAKTWKDYKFISFFSSHENGMAYLPVEESLLSENRKYNPLGEDERDFFSYYHAQLTRSFDYGSIGVAYTHLRGDYTVRYDPETLAEFGLGSHWIALSGVIGDFVFESNLYTRKHTNDVEDYRNRGYRTVSTFSYAKDRLIAGVRLSSFHYRGSRVIGVSEAVNRDWYWPSVNIQYTPNNWRFTLLTREPTRSDLFSGWDNIDMSNIMDLNRGLRPENNLGVERSFYSLGCVMSFWGNLYHNEIVATGPLTYIGLPVRENEKYSWRVGADIDHKWKWGTTRGFFTYGKRNEGVPFAIVDSRFGDVRKYVQVWASSGTEAFNSVILVNAYYSVYALDNLSVYGSLLNLLNIEWESSGYKIEGKTFLFPGNPRAFMLGVRWGFS